MTSRSPTIRCTLVTSPLPRRDGHGHDDRPPLTDEGLDLRKDLTIPRAHRQQVLSPQLLLLLVLDPEGAGPPAASTS